MDVLKAYKIEDVDPAKDMMVLFFMEQYFIHCDFVFCIGSIFSIKSKIHFNPQTLLHCFSTERTLDT